MENHKYELFKKSGMSKENFNKLLQLILKKVVIIPNEILLTYRNKALEIVKNIDLDDAIFIACALAFPNSIIWSDDKRLKKQTKVKILNTKEITKIL